MHWERGWPKQLYILFIIKIWNFTERDFNKDLPLQSQVYKNISRYYDKDFKITSLSQYSWRYWQIWNCFCLLRLILKTPPRITSQNLGSFLEKHLRWSFVIVKPLPLSFTVILLMFLKLMMNFILNFVMIYEDFFLILLILVSSRPYLNLKYADATTGGVLQE